MNELLGGGGRTYERTNKFFGGLRTYIRTNYLVGGTLHTNELTCRGGRTYERTNLQGDVHTNEPTCRGRAYERTDKLQKVYTEGRPDGRTECSFMYIEKEEKLKRGEETNRMSSLESNKMYKQKDRRHKRRVMNKEVSAKTL